MLNSWGQIGGDLLLRHLFDYELGGFYVDVGCADPEHLSNTRLFYEGRWRGICIDAEDRRARFKEARPEDIFIQAVVGEPKEVTLHHFSPDVITTVGQKEHNFMGGYELLGTEQVTQKPLSEILKENNVQKIDLLCIDTEGNDLEVLKTHNWDIRPRIIIVEEFHFYERRKLPELGDFLKEKGYRKIADTLIDGIYADTERYSKFLRD